jgi:flagellar biosynthesis GTPase FlhF
MKISANDDFSIAVGLHNAHVEQMHYHSEGSLTIDFKDGFIDPVTNQEAFGSLFFEKIDRDSSEVLVYKRDHHKIKGKIYSLKKFVKKYNDEEMEITDEYCGEDLVKFEGVIEKDTPVYFEMTLAVDGEVYYLINGDNHEYEEASFVETIVERDEEEPLEEAEANEEETSDEGIEKDVEEVKKLLNEEKEMPWNERVLIKNTTWEERKKIVEDSLGGDVTCAGDDIISEMYNDYIDGKIELADINKKYMKLVTGEE